MRNLLNLTRLHIQFLARLVFVWILIFSQVAFTQHTIDADIIKSSDATKTWTLPDASDQLLGETDPSITGSLTTNHITTPSNPSAGFLKLYSKSDNKLYKLTSAGVESAVGGGAASEVTVTPVGSLIATDVQAALAELDSDLSDHLNDAIEAHSASAISNVASGNLSATDQQAVNNELQTDIDSRATEADLSDHAAATASIHGITDTADLLTTTNTKAVTNKDIDGGTASNSRRITVPKDTKANLDALTRKEGTVVYGTDTQKLYIDDNSVLRPVGQREGGPHNLLKDYNFDFSAGVGQWTESGGTETFTGGLGNTIFDLLGYSVWDSNGAAQTYCTALVPVQGLSNNSRGGEWSFWTRVPSGTATHTYYVHDGTNKISNTYTLVSSTAATQQRAFFAVPSSGSVKGCIESVASNEPALDIDEGWLGTPTTIGDVSQASFFGSIRYAQTTNCNWSTTSASYADFAADTDCPAATVTGNVTAPGTKIPAAVLATMPAGDYYIVANGLFSMSTTSVAAAGTVRFSDGTNTFGFASAVAGGASSGDASHSNQLIGRLTVTAPQTNVTLKVQGKTSSGSNALNIANTAADRSDEFSISIYYFPTNSQKAVASDQADYGDTAVSPTLSAGFGTVTNNSAFHKRDGEFMILRGSFTSGTVAASLATITIPNGLSLDSTQISINNTSGNPGQILGKWTSTAADQWGYIVAAPATSTTLLYFAQNNASSARLTPGNGSSIIGSTAVVSYEVKIPITNWFENGNAPTLNGSNNCNSSAACKTVAARLNCDSGSAILSQLGTTSNGVSSVGNVSSGTCTVGLASGTYNAAPYCNVSLVDTGIFGGAGTPSMIGIIAVPTTSGLSVSCINYNGTTCSDYDLDLTCTGVQ